jgi:hypothetical protein
VNPTVRVKGSSNMYTLIEELLQEHEICLHEQPKAEKVAQSTGSVVSSSIFSTVTPLFIFDDDSVTVGGKPFIAIHKKKNQQERKGTQEANSLALTRRRAKAVSFVSDVNLDDHWRRWKLDEMDYVALSTSEFVPMPILEDESSLESQGNKRPYFRFEV